MKKIRNWSFKKEKPTMNKLKITITTLNNRERSSIRCPARGILVSSTEVGSLGIF
jgi:hypothetical protein